MTSLIRYQNSGQNSKYPSMCMWNPLKILRVPDLAFSQVLLIVLTLQLLDPSVSSLNVGVGFKSLLKVKIFLQLLDLLHFIIIHIVNLCIVR